MNRKRFGNRKKVLNICEQLNGLNEEKRLIVSNLMHDFEAHQSDRVCDLEERKKRVINTIRQQYQSCLMQIPSNIQKCLIQDIMKSGGSLRLHHNNNSHEILIEIPKSLFATNNSDLSQVMANKSRHAFNDMSAAINSFSGKKKNYLDSSNKAVVLKMPLLGSSLPNSPNKTIRLLRSGAKLKANTSTNTNSNPNKSKSRVLRTVEKTRSQEVIVTENDSVIKESKSTVITTTVDSQLFKTPFAKSSSVPFLTKPPRKPIENEEIISIFCSTSGTPLLVEDKMIQKIINNKNKQ